MTIKDYQKELKKTLDKFEASKKELDKLGRHKVLKRIRLLAKWTLQEFGNYMGVTKQRIHFIESGTKGISSETLRKYLKFIDEELSK